MSNLRIASIGIGLPTTSYNNDEIKTKYNLDTDNEWIKSRTGIENRYINESDQGIIEMAIDAAKQCVPNPEEIGAVIVAKSSDRVSFPSIAIHIHRALGLPKNVTAFDVSDACNGFIQILQLGHLFTVAHKKSVLLVGAEQYSKVLNWSDRSTCVLFGDGAGAIILEPNLNKHYAQTNYSLSDEIDLFSLSPYLTMNGTMVYKAAVESISNDVLSILKNNNITTSQIKYFIPHQANSRIINTVIERTGFNSNQVVQTIANYGNTGAASIPIALSMVYTSLVEGDLLLLTAFGAGLRGGSVLLEV